MHQHPLKSEEPPYQPYALLLIEKLYRKHGIRTVCLHSSWRHRILLEGRHRLLRSDAVAAHYMIAGMDWHAVAAGLRHNHSIVGVLPFEEGMVLPMVALAEQLDLTWAQSDVLPAFRDKFALKKLIAKRDPSVRLNAFTRVDNATQVEEFIRARSIDRFVLKPNTGSGNQQVSFFDRTSTLADVSRYLAELPQGALLEEFISGDEYYVNGQMDASGQPTVVGVGKYYRRNLNGVQNLQLGTISLSPDDVHFPMLVEYAEAVMRASGLRRSPFHLEAIIDEQGPCLVEVAARFCGELGTLRDNWRQGEQVDLIDVAAHYYVSDRPLGPLPLNPDRLREASIISVTGTSDFAQRLIAVDGVTALEKDPRFLFWVKKPAPGDHVDRTTNLTSRPWSVVLGGSDQRNPMRLIDDVRGAIRIRGTAQMPWRPGQRWRMFAGLASKSWSSRPRPYQAKALFKTLK